MEQMEEDSQDSFGESNFDQDRKFEIHKSSEMHQSESREIEQISSSPSKPKASQEKNDTILSGSQASPLNVFQDI